MTSSSPAPAPVPLSPDRGAGYPTGGLGPIVIWFMAHCHRCSDEGFSQPFRNETERDTWAIEHMVSTGHVVQLSIDGRGPDEHCTAMIAWTGDGRNFRFLCVARGAGCQRWVGPYGTPQLALADWRGHNAVTR